MEKELFSNRPRMNRLPLLPENPDQSNEETPLGRFPKWLHRNLPKGGELFQTTGTIKNHKLHTVCEEAKCPNRLECYSNKTATFLALGKACTRNCGFCDIDFSKAPLPPEKDEPKRISDSVQVLGLRHVVITMVARDDLPDQGASHIAEIIREVRKNNPNVTLEVLTSDFSGDHLAIEIVMNEHPEIFNHNIETVRRLTPRVRHKATYDRTLSVLSFVKSAKKVPFIKSGIMVGLGETDEEVYETIHDLYLAGCDIITIGHYLQPNRNKLRVKSFITPDQFKQYETYALSIGVKQIYSGPFVRSSYNAALLKDAAFQSLEG